MLTRIKELQQEIEAIVAKSVDEAEELRIKYLSKKGEISKLFEEFRNVSANQKKENRSGCQYVKRVCTRKNQPAERRAPGAEIGRFRG